MENLTEIIDYISSIILDNIIEFSEDSDWNAEYSEGLIALLHSNAKSLVVYNPYTDSYDINFDRIIKLLRDLFNPNFTFKNNHDFFVKDRLYILHELNINSKYKFT